MLHQIKMNVGYLGSVINLLKCQFELHGVFCIAPLFIVCESMSTNFCGCYRLLTIVEAPQSHRMRTGTKGCSNDYFIDLAKTTVGFESKSNFTNGGQIVITCGSNSVVNVVRSPGTRLKKFEGSVCDNGGFSATHMIGGNCYYL